MPKHLTYPLLAGIASAALFLLVSLLGLGFFFLFLPTLPLLVAGLSLGPRPALKATVFASISVSLVASLPAGVMFFVLLGFPAWYIADRSLLAARTEGATRWYPVGLVFLHLSLYACGLLALTAFYYTGKAGGLEQIVAEAMKKEFSGVEPEYADMLATLASQWAFLIFSITIWLWGLALYAHAWFAQRVVANRGHALRPDVAVEVFTLPNWMLGLLAICALASLIGSAAMQFLGKACLISLLLPYFLSGCAHMHKASANWPNRRFFLFFVYFMVFAQFWPALMIAGIGLWQHIKALSFPPPSTTG